MSRASTDNRRPEEIYEVQFQWPQNRPSEIFYPRKYPTNYIRTTKYTLYSFIPVNLFNQFRRFYNIYFLLAAIFVLVEPGLDPTSEIMPLCIVLLITAIKDGHEDYKRYKSDKASNGEFFHILRNGLIEDIRSRDIVPGDIMQVRKGERIPADLMIVASTGEDGVCYVDTVELDGETSLKRRTTVPLGDSTLAALNIKEEAELIDPLVLSRLAGHIECELPNERLNAFEGIVTLSSIDQTYPPPPSPQSVELREGDLPDDRDIQPLSLENLLLRGTFLRNTHTVYGIVIYAGSDTKIFKNLKQTGLKFATLERKLNRMIIFIFALNAILLVVSMCLAYINSPTQAHDDQGSAWYLGPTVSSSGRDIFGVLMTFFVLYTFLIPISVFVSAELIRLVQAAFMVWDNGMRSRDGKPMCVHNSNLNEDLGAVEYIFSDKTGTLTQNIMKLSRWWVQGVEYDEVARPGALRAALDVFHGRDRSADSAPASTESARIINEFSRCVALCHGTLPVYEGDGDASGASTKAEANKLEAETKSLVGEEEVKSGPLVASSSSASTSSARRPIYESPSPDETALLNGMRDSDVWLLGRTKDSLDISIGGVEERYTLLKVFEFSSDRKRMSVVVQNDRGIFLYCKGADSTIIPRLASDRHSPVELERLESDLTRLSNNGLRTLVMAYRPISEREWRKFSRHYEQAECALRRREIKMAKAAELIERELLLLGASAIEDKLQEDVPETISYLLQCDIRIWLLTGDKQETAIKIGRSSSLISPSMRLLILNGKSAPDCSIALDEFLEELDDQEDERAREAAESGTAVPSTPSPEVALVVNGESLIYILLVPDIADKFLAVGTRCRSVICCRVTPLQKALVVKLVKKKLGKVTLAIGDGANDVSMIQEAHVGVGIEGMEGAQAVRASDYSFVEFRGLRRLLSVHGRYSYLRMTSFILFSFYKSIMLIAVQFWFGLENAWCAQELYIDQFLTLWNVVFTSAPCITMACFDKDVSEEKIAQYPQLYRSVKDGAYWNYQIEGGWALASLYHSGVIMLVFVLTEREGVMQSEGRSLPELSQSLWVGSLVWIVVMGKSALLHRIWVWPSYVALGATAVVYILIMYMLEVIGLVEEGVFETLHQSGPFYFSCILAFVMCLLPDYLIKYTRRTYRPSDTQIIQESGVCNPEPWIPRVLQTSTGTLRKRTLGRWEFPSRDASGRGTGTESPRQIDLNATRSMTAVEEGRAVQLRAVFNSKTG